MSQREDPALTSPSLTGLRPHRLRQQAGLTQASFRDYEDYEVLEMIGGTSAQVGVSGSFG
jgi:hypothetical protein